MTEPTEAFNRRDLESEKVDDRSSTTGRTWRRHEQPATGVE